MLELNNSVLVIIDIQEKLVKAAYNGDIISQKAAKIAKAAKILSIPTIITEQYPKGLGETVDIIKANSNCNNYIEKSSFSALDEPKIKQELENLNRKQIILCGIEGHICVLQTAIDLIKQGYEVHILKDCTSSRNEYELNTAFELILQYGIKLSCLEIVLFEWLKSAKHPNFKEVQQLIK